MLRIMGLDVEPGCKGSRPCFSVVVLGDDERLVDKYESIPLHRVIRLVWEYRPDVIAIDNIYELASDEHELVKVVSMLPPSTEIVQVTRLPTGEYVDIRSLARLAGIETGGGKLSPSRTAYVAAVLALRGYGSRVRFVEEKTRIIVSKSRRVKHGGSSNPRFQRKVRSAILRAVRLIKHRLDRERLDYDLVFRKSSGGLDSATFIVYAPRSRLYGVVKPYEDNDIRVEVKPVYSSHIVFESKQEEQLQTTVPYLIVGVDPGISTGLAAIDINGNFVAALSRRGLDRGDVIGWIQQHGTPVLVATDVKPAPDFVKKLASSLGVPLYEPPVSLSVEEKRELVESYAKRYPRLSRILDSHIRDALAAALRAYNTYKSKLLQVESYASRIGIELDIDHVKAEVLKGVTIAEAIENAINRVISGIEPQSFLIKRVRKNNNQAQEDKHQSDISDRLHREIELLRAQNKLLEQKLRELTERLELLEKDYRITLLEYRDQVERDREINKLANMVSLLRSELEKLREENKQLKETIASLEKIILEVASGQLVPGLYFSDVGSEELRIINETAKTYGKMVLVIDRLNPVNWARYGRELNKVLIAVLVPESELGKRNCVESYDIPVLPSESYRIEAIDSMVFVEERVVTDAYTRLLELRKRREEDKKQSLSIEEFKRMISEYRAKRARLFLGGEKKEATS